MNITIAGLKEKNLMGTVAVPGDKSITHRATIFGSIAEGVSKIANYSKGLDCQNTIACMRALGAQIEEVDEQLLIIQGRGLYGLNKPQNPLNVGNSGTTIRLLSGLLSGQNFGTTLDGDDSIRQRPMKRVIEPLTLMNAQIKSVSEEGFAPLSITGNKLQGIDYTIPVASAQVKSALLLAGLYAQGKMSLYEPVKTRDHTEQLLAYMGADIQFLLNQRIVINSGNTLQGVFIDIPGDISSAAYFLALAAAREGTRLIINNVGINPTRIGFLNILMEMGAGISLLNKRFIANEPRADIKICGRPLRGISIGKKIIPSIIDELPLVAVIATQAQGTTIVEGAQELRVKESDRISAIVEGLAQMGADIKEREDGFKITGPTKLKGSQVESRSDHRIAMSMVIAGSYAEGSTEIKGGECINISYPDFIDSYYRLVN